MTSVRPPVVSRFAPSPTGYLHLGHLVNALYTWGLIHALGGQIILRMEDHDRGRCRPEYETAILDDLEWLGLEPDIGFVESFRRGPSPWRQSDRTAAYEALLADLVARGLVYTCRCSRKEILARTGGGGEELRYDGYCRARGYRPGEPGGTRVRLDEARFVVEDMKLGTLEQCPATQCGDLLLKDRHGNWTYQFAVTADDWQQGVNLIIRGEDLVASTARQVQLARLMGRPVAAQFLHHPLITDAEGKKLGKRDFAKGLRDYRAEGRTPESVLGEAAWRVGLLEQQHPLAATEIPGVFEGGAVLRAARGAFALH